MKSFLFARKQALLMSLAVLLLTGESCTTQTETNTTVTGTTVVDSTASAGDKSGGPAADALPPVPVEPGMTLPVLDALLYEPAFAQKLRADLALTDEEWKKLKGAAQAAVKDLDEHGKGTAYLNDAKAVAQKSEGQLQTLLGPERAHQLQQTVARRYAEGNIAGLLPETPNAVPADTRIVINAPSFRMDVFKEGSLVKSYLVGIGQQKYPLPAGMRHAENIIFNPTWTPPNEPWVRGKFAPGKTVAAGSSDNPLGPIKIPIGSPSLIHGGKQSYKLGNYASHGCVGLTNDGIRDFAATLLQVAGGEAAIADSSVAAYGKNRTRTRTEKLIRPIPVELRYETIVAEDGNLIIYRDVYARGTNTLDYADKVLSAYGLAYESLPETEKTALYKALERMNRNAAGKPIAASIGKKPGGVGTPPADDPLPATDTAVADTAVKKAVAKKTSKAPPKELAVAIAALAGKGYPAAVDMVGRPVATKKP